MALEFHFLKPICHIDFVPLGQIGITKGHIGIGKQEYRKKVFYVGGHIGIFDYAKLA
jgi:hypothetical protein